MEVSLVQWSEGDLELLRRCNTPEMTAYIGGPETEEKVVARHERYLEEWRTGTARILRIDVDGVGVGSVTYWPSDGEYEMGWSVVPEWQGRGISTRAVRLALAHATVERVARYVHAYPSVDNAPSNGVCRSAGFEFLGETVVEYPPGHDLVANNWRYDLERGVTL